MKNQRRFSFGISPHTPTLDLSRWITLLKVCHFPKESRKLRKVSHFPKIPLSLNEIAPPWRRKNLKLRRNASSQRMTNDMTAMCSLSRCSKYSNALIIISEDWDVSVSVSAHIWLTAPSPIEQSNEGLRFADINEIENYASVFVTLELRKNELSSTSVYDTYRGADICGHTSVKSLENPI